MKFIVYDKNKKILRTGSCSAQDSFLQAQDGEFIIEGIANDATQKVEFDGFDEKGQPINPRVIDKIPDEIEKDSPPEPRLLKGKQPANITNEQWQDVLKKLDDLEKR